MKRWLPLLLVLWTGPASAMDFYEDLDVWGPATFHDTMTLDTGVVVTGSMGILSALTVGGTGSISGWLIADSEWRQETRLTAVEDSTSTHTLQIAGLGDTVGMLEDSASTAVIRLNSIDSTLEDVAYDTTQLYYRLDTVAADTTRLAQRLDTVAVDTTILSRAVGSIVDTLAAVAVDTWRLYTTLRDLGDSVKSTNDTVNAAHSRLDIHDTRLDSIEDTLIIHADSINSIVGVSPDTFVKVNYDDTLYGYYNIQNRVTIQQDMADTPLAGIGIRDGLLVQLNNDGGEFLGYDTPNIALLSGVHNDGGGTVTVGIGVLGQVNNFDGHMESAVGMMAVIRGRSPRMIDNAACLLIPSQEVGETYIGEIAGINIEAQHGETTAWNLLSGGAGTKNEMEGYLIVGETLAVGETLTVQGVQVAPPLRQQAGEAPPDSFIANPLNLTGYVVLPSAFSDTRYAVAVLGPDVRTWSLGSKSDTAFRIDTSSAVALTGPVTWTATKYGRNF